MKNSTIVKSNLDDNMNKNSSITVLGIGGCGCNIVNSIYKQKIIGVDCVVCDTDFQNLKNSNVPFKIKLGVSTTCGPGTDLDPKIGYEAVMEAKSEIEKIIGENTKIIFLIAGLGGGTGTWALPAIAKTIREKGIFTVAIVTTPFVFEGAKRIQSSIDSAKMLKHQVDDFLLLENNKLQQKFGNSSFKNSFSKMDEIYIKTIEAVSEIIVGKDNLVDISKIPISEIGFLESEKVFGSVDEITLNAWQ